MKVRLKTDVTNHQSSVLFCALRLSLYGGCSGLVVEYRTGN